MNRRQLLQSALALPLLTVPVVATAQETPKTLWVMPYNTWKSMPDLRRMENTMAVPYGRALTGRVFDRVIFTPPQNFMDWPHSSFDIESYIGQIKTRLKPRGIYMEVAL